jgi:glucose-6-phosphate isomerase
MAIEEHISAQLGRHQADVLATLARLDAQRVIPRIWACDHTVWKPDPAEISNRLGWLHAPEDMPGKVAGMVEFVAALRAEGYTDALLLGMGGSSLAAEVFRYSLAPPEMPLRLTVLDSTDPGAVLACAEQLDPARTLYIVSTKSGGTVETISLFKYFYGRAVEALGQEAGCKHFVAITDPGSGVARLAEHLCVRAIFLNDPDIGGRNAALSYFGLLPAALAGVEVGRVLDRARDVVHDCEAGPQDNPAAWLGAVLGVLARAGRDKMTLVVSPQIAHFADWAEQLIAESSGKEGKGILPVVAEVLGPLLGGRTVYGDDRFFVHLRLDQDTSQDAAVRSLAADGFPVVRLPLRDPYDVGGQFFLWELANAVAGHILGINPFDQPNVEAAKVLARKMVAAYTERGALPPSATAPLDGHALRCFLEQARTGDYVAIQAYLQPTAETTAGLQVLRVALLYRLRLATTVGYGPRFLHSTGQLHKGDAGNGLFIQLTADDPRDAPIPDQPGAPTSAITFGLLKRAQAMGDAQALLDNGRRLIHFHLGQDVGGGLLRLAAALDQQERDSRMAQ